MNQRKPTLARFRADPEKVSVRIRLMSDGGLYRATVAARDKKDEKLTAKYTGPAPLRRVSAVDYALRAADRAGLPGIDLDMQWTYDHPWKNTGVK